MRELAQLPWWQWPKWWRRQRLQQLRAWGFDGGARSLGCTVLSPARGPGCWGGACKNLGGARDGLTERAGVRGHRARSKGLQLGTGVWEAGRAGPEGMQRGHALISPFSRGFAPSLLVPRFLVRPPRGGPYQAGSTWSWSPHSSSFPSFLTCSLPWRPRTTPKETGAWSGCPSGQRSVMAAGPLSGLVPRGDPSLLAPL